MSDEPEAEANLRDVFCLKLGDRFLVYSPLRRISALVNRPAVEKLHQALDRGRPPEPKNEVNEFIGLFFSPPPTVPAPRTGPLSPLFLGLIPTRDCNMSCVYCGFGAGSRAGERMSPKTAGAAAAWAARSAFELSLPGFQVHFFGGEPFLAPEVVEAAVHRARVEGERLGLKPFFEVATNGLVDSNLAGLIGAYFDVVNLSLDGPREIQDLHRPLSSGRSGFERTINTARELARFETDLCLRACVTEQSLGRMIETADWFVRDFQPAMITFETLQPTPSSQAAGLSPPDPFDFAVAFIRAARMVESRGVKTVYAPTEADGPRLSFCPVGHDALIVSPDGRVDGCYLPADEWRARGLDLSLGRFDSKGQMEIDQDRLKALRLLPTGKSRCRRCFCRWTCAGGCHVNNTWPGSPEEYTDFCLQTRLIAALKTISDLGAEETLERMLTDRRALAELASRPSDLLEDLLDA